MAEKSIPDKMSIYSEDRKDSDSTISGSLRSSDVTKDSSAPNSSSDPTVTDSPLSELSPSIDEPLTSTVASPLSQEDVKLLDPPELEEHASLSKNDYPQERTVASDEDSKNPDRLFTKEIHGHVRDKDGSITKSSSNLGLANISTVEGKSSKPESNFSPLPNPESTADVSLESKEHSTSLARSSSLAKLSDLPEEHWTVRAVYSGHFDPSSPEEREQFLTISFQSVLRKLIPSLEKLLKQFLFLNHLVTEETSELDCKEDVPDLPSLAQVEQRVLRSSEREFRLDVVPTLRPSIGTLQELKHELSLLKEIMRKSLRYLIKSSSDILAWCHEELNQQTLPESNVSQLHHYAERIGDIIKKLSEFRQRSSYFITNFVGDVDDLPGLTYIMSVRTQIALGYSRLLYELFTLYANFEKHVVRETFKSKSEY